MAVTRINNNQITDASTGNVYVGIDASTKLQNYSITAGKIANNLVYGSDFTVSGNLTVNGTSTAIDTTITTIEDPVIVLASTQTGTPAVDIGFLGERGDDTNIAFVWDESSDEFVTAFTSTSETSTTITITSYANLHTNDANIGGNIVINGTTSLVSNLIGAVNATDTITGGNLATPGTVSAVGDITGGNVATAGTVSATGNVTGGNVLTSGLISATGTATVGNLATGGTVSATGNITGGNISTAGAFDAASLSATGNITGGNLLTAGIISSTGTITSANTITGANLATGGTISGTGNITGGNVLTGGLVSATGNVTGGNLTTTGDVTTSTVTASSNIVGGNLSTSGTVIATGNIDGGNLNAVTGVRAITGYFAGNVDVLGNLNATIGVVYANSGIFYGNTVTGNNAAFAGIPGYTPLGSNVVMQFAGNVNSYSQLNFQNINSGNIASTDFIATADNGTDSSYYLDLGINSSTFDDPIDYPGYGPNDSYVHNHGGNLILNPESVGTAINFMVGGTDTTDVIGVVDATGLAVTGIVSATGTITGGNLATAGTASAGGNVTGANILTSGLISATGTATVGNLATGGTASATGTITGGNLLTGGLISATGNATSGNVLTDGLVSAGGNVTGANVLTAGLVTAGGNVTGANVLTGGVVSATGNITGANVNTAQVYGATTLTLNAGTGNINLGTVGNVVLANTFINGLAYPAQDQDAASKIYVDNMVSTGLAFHESVVAATTGNLDVATSGTVSYNNGTDGVGATLVTTGAFTVIDTANVQPIGTRILVKNETNAAWNGVYEYTNATTITRTTDTDQYGPDSSEELSLNDYFFVTGGNVNLGSAWVVDAPAGEITFGTTSITFAQFSQTQVYSANIAAGLSLVGQTFSAKIDNNTTAFDGGGNIIVKASANLTTPNIGAATGTSLSTTGTITGGNLETSGTVSATGTATLGNVATAGTVSATGNVTGGNVLTGGLISSTGTITSATTITGGNVATAGTVSATGDITGGNVLTGGLVSATGNVTGGNIDTGGAVNATATITGGNLATGGTISGTGTITGGNLATAGTASAGGNITGANILTGGLVSATATITGGNLVTGGLVSATGNITGGNIETSGLVSVGGNVISGNVNTSGLVSATGNVAGGNVLTSGLISATATITGGNIATAGTVSATGDITGGNILSSGNGSFTGTVTAANFIGNISGNIDAAGSNTQIQFNDTGDILGASAGFTFDKTSNTVTVTGTISGGNLATGGTTSATGNITGGNLLTGGLVSATGNVNAGNVNTVADIVASGNIYGGNLATTGDAQITGTMTAGNISTNGQLQAGNVIIQGDDITDNNGRLTFNSAQNDVDFAFYGDTVANVFYIDAGTGTASFGSSTQITNAVVAFNATSSILFPVGNIGTRPSTGVTGMVRFNTTNNNLEVFDNSAWTAVGVPSFTVIADEQFYGDGSTVAFTLGSTQTTNSCIVAINGVVQIPITAYSVSGIDPTCVLTFTEAPETGDVIDVREITTTTTVTSISNLSGNAVIGVSDSAAEVLLTGSIIPTGNGTQSLGSNTNRFSNVWLTGNTLTLGSIVMKDTGGQIGFFEADGTTPATIDSASVDTTTIANGTSSMAVIASGGNIRANIGGSTVQTISAGLVGVTGAISATGNITGSYILGNGSQLTGIDATSIQNGTSSVSVIASGGNVRANVAGATVTTTSTSGLAVTGIVSATGNITGANLTTAGTATIGTFTISGSDISSSGSTITIDPNATGGVDGLVIIQGNLQVNGNTTTINSNVISTNDLTYNLANNATLSSQANGGGIEVGPIGSPFITWLYNSTANTWTTAGGISATGTITGGNITVGTGTITGGNIVNSNANGVGNIGSSSTYFNTVFAKATSALYADLAEKYVADAEYAPGTVVVFGGTHEVTVNATDADRKVAGVVSTNPSYIMNGGLEAEFVATVALTGRVPCMVIGPVKKGDMMVAAGLGRARAEADPKVGTVIGKALEDFDGAEGTIEVVVGRF